MGNNADTRYDLVIIGGGPAGYVGAIRAGQLGLKTAIVERDKAFGGTCLLRGCIPTKALLHAADLWEHTRKLGVIKGSYELDFAAINAHKRKTVDKLAKGVEGLLKKNKVAIHKGSGRLRSTNQVEVSTGARKIVIDTDVVLLCTGSAPRALPGVTVDERQIVTSDGMLALESIPGRLVVLGAGAVGVEFASIYRRYGSQVTVIELLDRLVAVEDEEVSAELGRWFKRFGIAVHTSTRVTKAEAQAGAVRIEASGESGSGALDLEADVLLVAVGRRPVTEGIGLEELGVKLQRGFVEVDRFQRTSVAKLYAAGDIVPGPQLAHKASAEALVAVEHIAGLKPRPVEHRLVPGATYCEPEIGSVGLSEKAAREAGHEVVVGRFPFSALGRASLEGTPYGFVKIVAEKRYDEVLGVHIIGPKATELIAEAVTALGLEATSEELAHVIRAHPTLAEAMGEAAHAVKGQALHI